MSAIAVSIALAVPAAQAGVSGAASRLESHGPRVGATPVTPAAPETTSCKNARKVVRRYLGLERKWRTMMGAEAHQGPPTGGKPIAPCPRSLARRAVQRARAAREAWDRWRTLRDFPIRPGARAWLRAVDEVQRPFPGTKAWLLSCSASEGGWGRWVRHGGGPYYPGLEHADISSGHLQFKPGTFKGFYRRAVDDVRARGFRVPRYPTWVEAWRSATGQALAGAWGYVNGLRRHWVGSGC